MQVPHNLHIKIFIASLSYKRNKKDLKVYLQQNGYYSFWYSPSPESFHSNKNELRDSEEDGD